MKLASSRTNFSGRALINMLGDLGSTVPAVITKHFYTLFAVFCYHERILRKSALALIFSDKDDPRRIVDQCPICYQAKCVRLVTVDFMSLPRLHKVGTMLRPDFSLAEGCSKIFGPAHGDEECDVERLHKLLFSNKYFTSEK